jgi:hypothetical protein
MFRRRRKRKEKGHEGTDHIMFFVKVVEGGE